MANKQNLVKGGEAHRLTAEEQSMGGKASVEARRRKKELRELATTWLESEVGKDKKGNSLTGAEAMIQLAAKEALKGNAKFWELLRDTAGQKPVEKVMIADVDQSVIDEVERMVQDEQVQKKTCCY